MTVKKRSLLLERFETTIVRLEDGMKHHVLVVPHEVAERFTEAKVTRILLHIESHTYRRAIQKKRDGRRYVVLGKDILRETGLVEGDRVSTTIEEDPDPDHVEMVEEFTAVLEQNPEALARWETFTIGKQRSLALYVTGAKRSDTRIRRALELAEKIRTRTLHGDG